MHGQGKKTSYFGHREDVTTVQQYMIYLTANW